MISWGQQWRQPQEPPTNKQHHALFYISYLHMLYHDIYIYILNIILNICCGCWRMWYDFLWISMTFSSSLVLKIALSAGHVGRFFPSCASLALSSASSPYAAGTSWSSTGMASIGRRGSPWVTRGWNMWSSSHFCWGLIWKILENGMENGKNSRVDGVQWDFC